MINVGREKSYFANKVIYKPTDDELSSSISTVSSSTTTCLQLRLLLILPRALQITNNQFIFIRDRNVLLFVY